MRLGIPREYFGVDGMEPGVEAAVRRALAGLESAGAELVDVSLPHTDYGLAACVWTENLSTAHRLAAEIRAGTVYVNMLPLLDPAAVHGGFGASGSGLEMGPASIDEFTQTKGVWIGL